MGENYPQAISLIDSILAKSGDVDEKFDLLGRKHYFLGLLDANHPLLDDLLLQIHKTDPSNLDYRMKYIRNLFDKRSVWRAITEYLRFQADVEHTTYSDKDAKGKKNQDIDIQAQIK